MSGVDYGSPEMPEQEIELMIESSTLEMWTNAALEVGIPVDPSKPIKVEEVWEARNKLSDALGMAATEWDGWTYDHSRAARIATDLGVKAIEDTVRLGLDTSELLRKAVRSTYRHAPELFHEAESATLDQMAQLRDDARARLAAYHSKFEK